MPAGVRAAGSNVLRELRDGWREFSSRTWLWVVVAGFGVLNAIEAGAWNTLGPVIADTLGMLRWRLSRPLLVAALVTGVGVGVFAIAWDTVLGQQIPLDKLSRISAYDALGSLVALPLGQVAAGRLATAFPPTTLVLAGTLLYAAVTLAILLNPDVRHLRATDRVGTPV